MLQIVIDMFFLAIISSSLRLEKNPSRACCDVTTPIPLGAGILPKMYNKYSTFQTIEILEEDGKIQNLSEWASDPRVCHALFLANLSIKC